MEQSVIIVEPEKQRADRFTIFCQPKTAHDAIGRIYPLNFYDRVPLTETIWCSGTLCNHAVEPLRPTRKPLLRRFYIARYRRELHVVVLAEVVLSERFEYAAPLLEPAVEQRFAVVDEDVENVICRRRFDGEFSYARCGRMNALKQRVEIQPSIHLNRELTI